MVKLQPAIRHLRYLLTHNTGAPNNDDSHFIDIARDLSALNRRSYRQGKVYHIAGITVHDTDTNPTWVKIGAAPDTWMTRNAWYKGFKLWMAMNEQVTENPTGLASIEGKYADYKVFLSRNHITHYDAGTDVAGPHSLAEEEIGRGEWEYSKYFLPREGGSGSPDYDETNITLLGPNNGSLGSFTSVGLLAGYEETRALPQSAEPSVPGSVDVSWQTNLFDMGDVFDDIAGELMDANDAPPYARVDYTGGANQGGTNPWVGPALIGQTFTTSTIQVGRVGPLSAICGLLEVVTRSDTSNNVIGLTVELMPGQYKGVAATDIRQ